MEVYIFEKNNQGLLLFVQKRVCIKHIFNFGGQWKIILNKNNNNVAILTQESYQN